MPRKPETKLMNAIFLPCWFEDDDLHETVGGQTLHDTLYQAIDQLTQSKYAGPAFKQRIKRIIELRFGFGSERPHTLEEVGKEFDRTGELIRHNEAKALRMLRHPRYSNKLKPFIKDKDHE